MRYVLFAPYGSLYPENGLMYLLANYMRRSIEDIVQLRCNGVFSLCDKDSEHDWRREFATCGSCMGEQRELSSWCGIDHEDLSRYLKPHDIVESKRWVGAAAPSSLLSAEVEGLRPAELCAEFFERALGRAKPDLSNKRHAQFFKKTILGNLRMYLAARRFLTAAQPLLCFVSGQNDVLTSAFVAAANSQGIDVVRFYWDMSKRSVCVTHPSSGEILECDLLVERVARMRSDSATWPAEFITRIEEILEFLGVDECPQALPIAR